MEHDLDLDLTIQKYSCIVSESKYLMTSLMAQKATDISNNGRTKRTKPPAFKVKFSKVRKHNKWFLCGCEEMFKFQLLFKTVIYLSKLTQILLSLANGYSSS